MAGRLSELSAKAQRFPQRRRPSHEDLPCELLYLEERLAPSHSPDRSIGRQLVRRVQQRISVLHAPIELKVSLGFLAAPDLLPAAGHVTVVVILMKYRRDQRRVHH